MINKDRKFFQYNSAELVYIISPLMSQLHSMSRKVAIKYVEPANIRTNQGDIGNLAQLKQIINIGMKV